VVGAAIWGVVGMQRRPIEEAGKTVARQPRLDGKPHRLVPAFASPAPGVDGTDSFPGGVLVGEVVAPGMCAPEVWENCTVVSKLQQLWRGTLIPSGLLPVYHVPGQVAPLGWNLSMAVGLE